MTEIAIVIAALTGFCLITFGAAGLVAMWMSAPPKWWLRSHRRISRRRPDHPRRPPS